MHDGSIRTLREVVQHYNRGGEPNLNADVLIRPLGLTEQEVDDLVAFLEALTDTSFTTNPALLPLVGKGARHEVRPDWMACPAAGPGLGLGASF